MRQKWLFIFFYFACALAYSQDTVQDTSAYYPSPLPFPNKDYPTKIDSSLFFSPQLFSPIIGVGPGILTFFGDLAPKASRFGYHLTISEYVKPYLLISARAMFGKLGANENSPRYANFRSTIRSGGINVSYNFDHFLPKQRKWQMSPFLPGQLHNLMRFQCFWNSPCRKWTALTIFSKK